MNILLKNGLIYDGTGKKPSVGDIYIENRTIKKIGTGLYFPQATVIDCSNLMIAPGFIDAHSHNDYKVNRVDAILPFLRQGITTQIVGNCGTSAYGISEHSSFKNDVGAGLFSVRNPKSLKEFSQEYAGKLPVNLIPLIGHGTVRISVSGLSPKELSKKELEEELYLTNEAMKEGAFGGSLGLMYEPGMYAPLSELKEFSKVIAKYDGILTVHPRACSKVAMGYPLIGGKPHIERGLDEVIDIMKESHVRTEYSHLIFVGESSWKCVNPMLEAMKKARKEGFEIAFDMYPFTFGASVITVVLPGWYLKLSPKAKKNPINRLKLKLIISITKKLLGIEFSDMIISYIGEGYEKYEGKNVEEIAKEENETAFDTYLRLVDLSQGKGSIMLGKYYNEEIVRQLMNDELSVFMTDAWYVEKGAQNASAYQAFPFFLEKARHYSLPLEQVIRKMTGATADRFRIDHRGYLKEGYAADITIFDYGKIQVNQRNPQDTPKGIEYVIVNGELVLSHNEYSGKKPGILLLKKCK